MNEVPSNSLATPADPASPPSEANRRKASRPGWLMLLMLVVLASLSLPDEITKWRVARAIECENNSDRVGALKYLDAAQKRDPASRDVFFAYWERVADRDIEDPTILPLAYSMRGLRRYFQGNVEGAYKDAQMSGKLAGELLARIEEASVQDEMTQRVKANILNTNAYLLALCGKDLDEALKNAEGALEIFADEKAFLDTRGFVRFKLEEFASARADFDQAIRLSEAAYDEIREQLSRPGIRPVRREELEKKKRAAESDLVILLYHRLEALRAMKLSDAASEDERRIRAFGLEPRRELF